MDCQEKLTKTLSSEYPDWVKTFYKKNQRLPKILHIGNIANNAYNNAKILNKGGFDCDVIAYNYYHIMGCPEWEDADFEGEIRDQFFPDWQAVNLKGFRRPRWFAQGVLHLCIYYLLARREGQKIKAVFWWHVLNSARCPWCVQCYRGLRFVRAGFRKCFSFVVRTVSRMVRIIICCMGRRSRAIQSVGEAPSCFSRFVQKYAQYFPQRQQRLAEEDLTMYKGIMPYWQKLFQQYDSIQAYATDGILPLLAGKPYIAYEHGTIRDIPFQNTLQGKLCALTYVCADHVCITNADNVHAAEKLGIKNYTFVPHPINEDFLTPDKESERVRAQLCQTHGTNFIVFHPARQHWDQSRDPNWEKGNDIFIKGFAQFVKIQNPCALAVFAEWGKKVEESKRLIAALGITKNIVWISPKPHRQMARYIHAADLVADQFFLGAFGSIMPKTLACGKPAMLYLNTAMHTWCFPQMPPVVNTRTEEDVYEGLKRLFQDKAWALQLREQGRQWYQHYHSNAVIQKKFGEIYRKVIEKQG